MVKEMWMVWEECEGVYMITDDYKEAEDCYNCFCSCWESEGEEVELGQKVILAKVDKIFAAEKMTEDEIKEQNLEPIENGYFDYKETRYEV